MVSLFFAGLREHTKKRISQSKRARAGSLANVDEPKVARTCVLLTFGLQMSCRPSLELRLFRFVSFSFSSLRFR